MRKLNKLKTFVDKLFKICLQNIVFDKKEYEYLGNFSTKHVNEIENDSL